MFNAQTKGGPPLSLQDGNYGEAHINFIVGACPAHLFHNVILLLNYIEEKGLIHVATVPAVQITNSKIVEPGPSGRNPTGAISTIVVYASCTRSKFKEVFGFEYDVYELTRLSEVIQKDIDREAEKCPA